MEAACDLSVIWSKVEPKMRIVIGGLAGGGGQAEIASEAEVDRFKVARMSLTGLACVTAHLRPDCHPQC
jgi:hypothetical protein